MNTGEMNVTLECLREFTGSVAKNTTVSGEHLMKTNAMPKIMRIPFRQPARIATKRERNRTACKSILSMLRTFVG